MDKVLELLVNRIDTPIGEMLVGDYACRCSASTESTFVRSSLARSVFLRSLPSVSPKMKATLLCARASNALVHSFPICR